MSNPVGRPPIFKTPEEFDAKVDEYFKSGRKVVTRFDKEGNPTEVPVTTITGLALYLGFSERQTLYEYQKHPEFCDSVKRARARVEAEYESNLTFNNPAGSIFALKNFGWTDKQDVALQNPDGSNLFSPDLLAAAAKVAKGQ